MTGFLSGRSATSRCSMGSRVGGVALWLVSGWLVFGSAVDVGAQDGVFGARSAAETSTELPELLARITAREPDRAALAELARRGAAVHRYLVGRLRNPGSGTIPREFGEAFGGLAAMAPADRAALRVLAKSQGHGNTAWIAASVVARFDAIPAKPAARTLARPGASVVDAPRGELWAVVEAWLVDAGLATEALEELLLRRSETPRTDVEGHAQLDRIERALRDWASASSLLEPRAWQSLAGPVRRAEWQWIGLSGGAEFGRSAAERVEALLAAAADDDDPAVRGAAVLALRTAGLRDQQVETALVGLEADPVAEVARRAKLVRAARAVQRRMEAAATLQVVREELRSESRQLVERALYRLQELGPDAGELAAEVFALGLATDPAADADGRGRPGPHSIAPQGLRGTVARALAALGDATIEVLQPALHASDVDTRLFAAQVLGQFRDLPAVAAPSVIQAAYVDAEETVRRAAENSVWELQADSAGPLLIRLMVDRPELRDGITRALERLAMNPDWREVLASKAEQLSALVVGEDDSGDAVREQVFRLLNRLDRVPPNQHALLTHRDARVRHAALRLLFAPERRAPEWFDAVEQRLADDDESVRAVAVSVLASFDGRSERAAEALLGHAVEFDARASRLACARAVVQLGSAAAEFEPILAGWVADAAEDLQTADELGLLVDVFRLVSRPGTATARDAEAALRARLADPDPARRAATMLELSRAGAGALPMLDAVLAGLDDPDAGVQKWAVYCLRDLGPAAASALPRLEALRDAMPGTIEAHRAEQAIEAIRR